MARKGKFHIEIVLDESGDGRRFQFRRGQNLKDAIEDGLWLSTLENVYRVEIDYKEGIEIRNGEIIYVPPRTPLPPEARKQWNASPRKAMEEEEIKRSIKTRHVRNKGKSK